MLNNCSIFSNHGPLNLFGTFEYYMKNKDIGNEIRPYLGYCENMDHIHYFPKKYTIKVIIDNIEKEDTNVPDWCEKNGIYTRDGLNGTDIIQIYDYDITDTENSAYTTIINVYMETDSTDTSLYATINTSIRPTWPYPLLFGQLPKFSVEGYGSAENGSTGFIINNLTVTGNVIIDVSTCPII